jgi:hypothetical protein
MKLIEWPRGPIYLLSLSILLFVLPDNKEGIYLLNIGEGHGLSLLDTLALIPLLISVGWIQKGLWSRRIYLFNKITMYPGSASLLIFFIGLGLGLLIASAFKTFLFWWAIGGAIFILLLIYIVLTSGKSRLDKYLDNKENKS